MSGFGDQLKSLRKIEGLTQRELAEKVGLKQNSYSDWENGKLEPNIEMLVKLADYFGVSIDYLMSRKAKDTTEEFEELFKTIYKDFILAIREWSFKRMEIVANLPFFGELADLIHNLDIIYDKDFLIKELKNYREYLEKKIILESELPEFVVDIYKHQLETLNAFPVIF